MAMDTWGGTEARQIGTVISNAATRLSTCSETPLEMMTDLPPRQKATRGHRQAIAELGLLYRPANAEDLEAHRLRLELMATHCSEISPALLREACDRVAKYSEFLPRPAELLAVARQIMEERQRAQPRHGTVNSDGEIIGLRPDAQLGDPGDNVERCRERNMQLMREGATYRVFPVGAYNMGRVQVVDDGAIWPTHACTGDGMFRNMLGKKSGLWPQ
jgi:hypothetical protein